MRRFDVKKQLEGETLTVFEQSLRMLHREAWPKMDIKSPEADSLLRRKFADGILDLELQKYLRLHAASDDFATTVSKARQFVDANELSCTTKKTALSTTTPNVNYQTIIDGVMEALEQRDRVRAAEVNAVQTSSPTATTGNRNKKAPPRQGSPAPTTRPPEVPPAVRRQLAVRFGSRTRWMLEQAIGATSRLQGVVGRTTGPHRVTTAVLGRGQIVVRQGRSPLAFGSIAGMVATPGWSACSVATVRRSVVARERGPTFSSPGPGQCRQLETWLAIDLKRSQWSVAGGATTLEPRFNRPAVIACHQRADVPSPWVLRLRSFWVPFSSS